MPFRDYFSSIAEKYAEHRPGYPAEMFDYLASLAPGRDLAWDCGTGSGQAALELAGRFDRVIATDASAEQLKYARPHPRITYLVERAERSSNPANSVDLITAGTAVHWFDFDAFYEEVRRAGKPGGVLAVWTYFRPYLEPHIDEIIFDFYGKTLNGYWPERIHYLAEGYRTLPFPFEEIEPPEFHVEAQWTLEDLLGFLSSWSAVKRYLEQEDYHPVGLILDDLKRYWGQEDQQRTIRWPLYFRIGRLP